MWEHVISRNGFVSYHASPDEALCSGKWLVPLPSGDPDDLWDRLVAAAVRGDLDAAKCSSARLEAILGYQLACVYCRFSDEAYVAKTLQALRCLGVAGPLNYKSDRATVEGRDEHLWTSDEIEGGPEYRP